MNFLNICQVLNSLWLLITGLIGIYVTALWTTNKVIQHFICKHERVLHLVFKDAAGQVYNIKRQCTICNKILKDIK